MAYCYCDECKFKNDCTYYRKVIICPYVEDYTKPYSKDNQTRVFDTWFEDMT